MALDAGTKLGPYEIISPLGAGGMGEVYRANDTRLERDVALKVLTERYRARPDALGRFETEARAVAAFNHPNVVAIYDIGRENELAYLVTELLYGGTLRELLGRGPIPYKEALGYSIQVAQGLAAAHALGIVHRDLKPENIFLTGEHQIKLLDFGLAKVGGAASGGEPDSSEMDRTQTLRTAPGVILGTVGYMSPEQVRGHTVDHRTDVFAFGAVLFEMLSGRRAFGGNTPADTMSSLLSDTPPDVSTLQPQVPMILGQIVGRCMRKLPDERFDSVKDLAFVLEALNDDRTAVSAGSKAAATSPVVQGKQVAVVSKESQSIAVLPFSNTSNDSENDYLADGIAEDIINALSPLDGLRVAARSSSFAFRGDVIDHAEVGRKLSVDTVVEGSVRRSGNRLRITAQLVNLADGYQLWSERFDREMTDIFAVQDEIASAVADRLRVSLSGSSDHPLIRPPTSNMEAYDLFMRARFIAEQRGDNLGEARDLFEKATELDPKFALAHAGLAFVYALMSFYGFIKEDKGFPYARNSATTALALDSRIADAKVRLGW